MNLCLLNYLFLESSVEDGGLLKLLTLLLSVSLEHAKMLKDVYVVCVLYIILICAIFSGVSGLAKCSSTKIVFSTLLHWISYVGLRWTSTSV